MVVDRDAIERLAREISHCAAQIDATQSELAEQQERLRRRDAAGWDSADDELATVRIVLETSEALARVGIDAGIDPELRSRAIELERELDAEEEVSVQWARSVAIVVRIPPTVIQDAERHFGRSPQYAAGVYAYCRHQLTNYEALLNEAPRSWGGRVRDVLRERINEAVSEVLKQYGIDDEWDL